MSDLCLFKDLYKPWKDLNVKGFDATKNKLQVKTSHGGMRADAWIEYAKSTYSLLLDFPVRVGNFPLLLSATAASPNRLDLSLEHKGDGLTVTKTVSTSPSGPPELALSVTREVAPAFVSLTADYRAGTPSFAASVVSAAAGATFGALLSAAVPKGDFSQIQPKWALGFRTVLGRGRLGAIVDPKGATVGYASKYGERGHLAGAEVVIDAKNPQAPQPAVVWEDPSKAAPMKARFSPVDGLFQLSVGQFAAPHLKVTLSADILAYDGLKSQFGVTALYDESL
eukprot:TRINITY_DN44081_c0_g1_i1.p1 TRINITY_DN44081_c0_g1~~TRINITY_DN44081_c0_g1_i1.p1  ORF type:complete len:321 (+),score=52.14 TRINITY_DN44081_c0_g1_i1:118-963(+)